MWQIVQHVESIFSRVLVQYGTEPGKRQHDDCVADGLLFARAQPQPRSKCSQKRKFQIDDIKGVQVHSLSDSVLPVVLSLHAEYHVRPSVPNRNYSLKFYDLPIASK